jgi:NAD(P)-dependent dehydrogenase (short-subunit alcohol dehydrogenase family)
MAADGLRTYTGAVAIVTGGASGIGAALGRALARRGSTVVLADRQRDAAARLAAALRPDGGVAEAVELDVRDGAAVEALVADVVGRYGRIDYVFNNAGVGVGGAVRDYTLDDWRYVVEVNLMGVIHGAHAAYGRMIAQGFGHIVNTASMAGWMPTPYMTVYGTTKHAVVGLSRSLRIEGGSHGVQVSVLCPGVIRTPLLVDAGQFGRTTIRVPPALQLATWERLRPMDPDRFADQALDRIARNQSIIILPRWWRLVFWLNRLSPTWFDALGARSYEQVRREFEHAAAEQAQDACEGDQPPAATR